MTGARIMTTLRRWVDVARMTRLASGIHDLASGLPPEMAARLRAVASCLAHHAALLRCHGAPPADVAAGEGA